VDFPWRKPPLSRPLRLILASDSHDDRGLLDTFVDVANRASPDAVVMAGDFQSYGTPKEWRTVDAGWAALKSPLLAVPGNHDHRRASLPHFQHLYGQVPRGVDLAGCHLVLIDDGAYHLGDQLDFLERDLAAHAGRRTIVIAHVPLDLPWRLSYLNLLDWLPSLHHDDPHAPDHLTLPEPDRSRLLAILQRYHVDALVTGHLHSYGIESLPGGIPSLHVGTVGGYLTEFGEPHSYLAATITDQGIELGRRALDTAPPTPWALIQSWQHYQRTARSIKGP
jgi:predicted phosphodiesterase